MEENRINPETLSTEYLAPDECRFYITEAGFTGAEIKGKDYARVILKRALPFAAPDEYICVTDAERNEIGILRDLGGFSEEQRQVIDAELSLRYFIPIVTDIYSIKEKMGHFYFDVKANGAKRTFTVRDLSKNVHSHGQNVDITDVDGNRYRIADLSRVPAKSRRKLEPYLY